MMRVYLNQVDLPLTKNEQRAFPDLPFGKGDYFSYVGLNAKSDEKALIAHLRQFIREIGKEYGTLYVSIHGTPKPFPKVKGAVDPWAVISADD